MYNLRAQNHGFKIYERKTEQEVQNVLIPLLEAAEKQELLAKALLDNYGILTEDLLRCVDNFDEDSRGLIWDLDQIGRLYVRLYESDDDE